MVKRAALLVDIHCPEVALKLVFLSILSRLAALTSADITRNLWSLVCSCLNSYCTFHLFPILIFFLHRCYMHWVQHFHPIFFIVQYNDGSPYFCDGQVGYSAGGYSLSPRWFLTWYICPFFQDQLHWWVLTLHETYDHWPVAVLTVTVHFIHFQVWFFLHRLFSALNSIFLPHIFHCPIW